MSDGELIALAIIKAMRNDPSEFVKTVKKLRQAGLNDYEISEMFQEVGRLIFNEPEPEEPINETEEEDNE
jgi:hypothetical protein